jgi:hypothetical protein
LISEYGGEWLRPDVGELSCMPRMPVGLANHPALNFNWQLTVALGCLNSSPSCLTLPVGQVRASDSRLAEVGRSGRLRRERTEIAELRACRLAMSEAKAK